MKKILKEEKNHPDHAYADSFALAILSHGREYEVTGVDSKRVKIQEIMTYFDGKNAPSLSGKPKLIVVQACQGGECKNPYCYFPANQRTLH